MKILPLKKRNGSSDSASQVYHAQSVGRFTRDNFGALDPRKLKSIISSAHTGDLEGISDLASYVIRTDPHARSVITTRLNAVAGADIEVTPGPHSAADEGIAEDAAGLVREAIDRVEEWEDRFGDLLYGTFLGVSAMENIWRPERGTVWGDFAPILTRDLSWQGQWCLHARTYTLDADGNATGSYTWESLRDHPGKFTISVPHNFLERPTMTGEIYPILWPWLFKRWIEKFGLEGFGKLANGLLFSTMSADTEPNAVDKRLEDLERLSADGAAVFKQGPGSGPAVELLEAARDPGSTGKMLLDYYNAEISKSVLGSGLNVEVGSTGGNRALGESQFDTTILPRLQADGKRALGALRRDWVRPFLGFNRHKFGGRMPPVPFIRARLGNDTATITPELISTESVTHDELRIPAGLIAWGPEKGGDEIAKVAPPAPVGAFSVVSQDLVSGGAPVADMPRARIEHQPGGEWAVLDASGSVVDVTAHKAEAVDKLRDLLTADPVVTTGGGEPEEARPFLSARGSTPTPSGSPTPLEMALSRQSDDRAR